MRLPRFRSRNVQLALCALFAAVFACLIYAWRPAIAEIPPPAPASFPPALVARGEALAHIGDCISCHVVTPHAPFAGGTPLTSAYGTFYGPNITPDPETGIGRWSEKAFARAIREGIARDGGHLYPALPYVHFTHVSDADVAALYAYLMTRAPVRATAPANRFNIPPLGFRPVMAGWKLLFFRPGRFVPDPKHDAIWNRGAYLAEGLAHCQSCHTPMTVLGEERRSAAYRGGFAGRNPAPPLDGSGSCGLWTTARLESFLRTGRGPCGPAKEEMAEVTANLSHAPPEDVHAIAIYMATRMKLAR